MDAAVAAEAVQENPCGVAIVCTKRFRCLDKQFPHFQCVGLEQGLGDLCRRRDVEVL